MRPALANAILLMSLSVLAMPSLAHAEPPNKSDASRAPKEPALTTDKTDKKLKAAQDGNAVDIDVKTTEKDEEGVKTFKFGAVEVEGRLKAPQILYFLRRVRAEFRAGLLGHRSFMPELMHTRHHPALR